MKCRVCGSSEIYDGACFRCGSEEKSDSTASSQSLKERIEIFSQNYDAGFVAGKTQAATDFHTSFINMRLLERLIVPSTERQMGYIDGYCGYIDDKKGHNE